MTPKKSNVMTLSLHKRILCLFGGVFYEAKVIEVGETEDGEPQFLVHYQGWHKRHDEWIEQSEIPVRVKPFTDKGLAKAKAHLIEVKAARKQAKRVRKRDGAEGSANGSASRDTTPSKALGSKAPSVASEKVEKKSRMRKAADDEPAKERIPNKSEEPTKELIPKKSELSLHLPLELKQILVGDGHQINRKKLICNLPARFTVEDIIKDFCQEVGLERSEQDAVQMIQSSRGVQHYFDNLLPVQLLYKQEKVQYSKVIEFDKLGVEKKVKGKRGRSVRKLPPPTQEDNDLLPSKFYGFPHLLRLLTRFDNLMKISTFSDLIAANIMKGVNDFTVWLNKNRHVYYDARVDYDTPPADYLRDASIPPFR